MQIHVQYETQLKRAIGAAEETIDVDDGASVSDVVRAVAERHTEAARSMLLDSGGEVRSSILVFLGEEQWSRDAVEVRDGDTLTLMSPISGG